MNYKSTTLEIDGILCNSLIGCYDFERHAKQDLQISLLLELGSINTHDELTHTVDYWDVCTFVKEYVESTAYHLLESLAEQIADVLLAKYSLIKAVSVSICKLSLSNIKSRYIKCHHHKQRCYKIALALGSNMNNPRQQVISAIEMLAEFVVDIQTAPIYRSSPLGYTNQDDFYNTCISGYTTLAPDELLMQIKKLEKLQGKVEQFANGPRIIDIDVIFFADMQFSKGWFTVPHEAMHERDFVLLPLSNIEPNWLHPVLNKTVVELIDELETKYVYTIEE